MADPGSWPCAGGWCWANFPLGASPEYATGWGSAPDDVWVGASLGTMLHLDGHRWSATWVGFRSVRGVWGTSAAEAWALDSTGATLRWDGVAWTELPERAPCRDPASPRLSAAGGVGWCSAPGATLARFDGARWETVESPPTVDGVAPGTVGALWAAAPDDVFMAVTDRATPQEWSAIVRYTAGRWSAHPILRVRHITGSDPDDVWADGDALWHFDGTRWTETALDGTAFVAARGDLWNVSLGFGTGSYHWVDGTATRKSGRWARCGARARTTGGRATPARTGGTARPGGSPPARRTRRASGEPRRTTSGPLVRPAPRRSSRRGIEMGAWRLVDEPVHLTCGSGSIAWASDGTLWERDPAWR